MRPFTSFPCFSFLANKSSPKLFHCLSVPQTQLVSATKTINAYCKSGSVELARKVLDEMPLKNIVSFSTMIYGYATHGFFTESIQLFLDMQRCCVRPNSFTFVAVFVGLAAMQSSKLIQCIHGEVIKYGFESNHFVGTALLDAYAKCGDLIESYTVFSEMNSPGLVSCNGMISAFVLNDLFEEALLLFKRMWAFGVMPNSITMLKISQSCIGYESFELCSSVHADIIKLGLCSHVSVMNAVLEMYLCVGNLECGMCFFREMDVKDVISWTTMIGFYLDTGCAAEALDMFNEMRANGVEPDAITLVNVISACAITGDLNRARCAQSQAIIHGFGTELPVINSLIKLYSRGGDSKSARIIFDRVSKKSLVSWTAMISGYTYNGQPREGLELLIGMRSLESFSLDSVVLVCAIAACGEIASFQTCKQFHSCGLKLGLLHGKSVQNSLVSAYGKCGHADFAFRVFQEMVCLDIVSWNAMITSYGINGKGKEAVALFRNMEKCGQEADSVTYLSLLMACNYAGLVNNGLIILNKMLKDERIEPREEHYACLVDMLLRAGRLGCAENIVNTQLYEVSPNVWKALLGGANIHGDIRLAEIAAERVFYMDSRDSGHVLQLSNAFASVGKFEHAEALRTRIRKNGLVKKTGLSLLDALPSDVG
ncbi:putative tetratricopeptide-like helical domain superfamily [Dioscorea sansibarensis]